MNKIEYFNKKYELYHSPLVNNNIPRQPFHKDMKMLKIILEILNKYEVFIETGSYIGKTIYFVGKNFPSLFCYSCEIDAKSYRIAHEQVKTLSNIKLDHIASPLAVYAIKQKYDKEIYHKTVCFWLDAHWHTNPLFDELKYITINFNKFCIFIDDFKIPNDPGFSHDGYTLEKIKPYIYNIDKLRIYIPNYRSTDECCKNSAVGYLVITNMLINTFDYLKEIHI